MQTIRKFKNLFSILLRKQVKYLTQFSLIIQCFFQLKLIQFMLHFIPCARSLSIVTVKFNFTKTLKVYFYLFSFLGVDQLAKQVDWLAKQQIGQLRSRLVNSGVDWLAKKQIGYLRIRLVSSGVDWLYKGQIGQLRSRLVSSGEEY